MPCRTAHLFFFKKGYMEGNTQFFVSYGKQLTSFSSKLLDPSVPQKTAFQKTAINSTRNQKYPLTSRRDAKEKRASGEVTCYPSNRQSGNCEKDYVESIPLLEEECKSNNRAETKGHYHIKISKLFIFEHYAFQSVLLLSDVFATVVVFTPTRPSRSLGKEHLVQLVVLIRPVLNLLVPTCCQFSACSCRTSLDNDI